MLERHIEATDADHRIAAAQMMRPGHLRDLLCLLPSWPKSRVLELAPAFWKQTREHEDAQQRLAANVFRIVMLADHAPPV